MSSAGTDPGCSVDDEDLVDDDHGDADGGDHHHGHHPDLVLRRETPTALHLAAVQIRATRKCESVSQSLRYRLVHYTGRGLFPAV